MMKISKEEEKVYQVTAKIQIIYIFIHLVTITTYILDSPRSCESSWPGGLPVGHSACQAARLSPSSAIGEVHLTAIRSCYPVL